MGSLRGRGVLILEGGDEVSGSYVLSSKIRGGYRLVFNAGLSAFSVMGKEVVDFVEADDTFRVSQIACSNKRMSDSITVVCDCILHE